MEEKKIKNKEELKKKLKNKQQGITLIALVITIHCFSYNYHSLANPCRSKHSYADRQQPVF